MREIIAVDCETDPFKHGRIPAPFVWGWYDGAVFNHCTETRDLLDYLKTCNAIAYAHNGGKFDWHFVLPFLSEFIPLQIINGRISSFKIGLCEFRDSFNLLPTAQKEWADKTEIEDWSIFEAGERDKPENWSKIMERLETDCKGLFDKVSRFNSEYGLNLTLAGAAMKFWRKNYMKGEAPKSNASFYEVFKPYYFGGRVECFQKGLINKPFSMVDIKSAYPFAMTQKHAWGFDYIETDTIDDLSAEQISRSFITLAADSLGAFPFRTKTGLSFPNDKEQREFNITGWEFISAVETGHLRNHTIKRVLIFSESINFIDYVNHFFNLKNTAEMKGDKTGRFFAKLFLNSLYGKFAANPANYQDFITAPLMLAEDIAEDDWILCKQLTNDLGVFNRPLPENQHRYYNLATAASVTGFVRAYLWQALQKVSGLLYCDTDCIVAHDVSALALGDGLGAWETAGEFSSGGIGGKKLYAFREARGTGFKIASKGVRLTASEILRVASGEAITYRPDAPTFAVSGPSGFLDRVVKLT